MHINEQYHDLPLLETQTYQFIGREGEILTKEEQVLNEHLIDVYLNDQLTMKLICLPQNLTELVLGRLLTEHIIQSIDDVEQIYICEYGKRAKVYLKQSQATDAKKNTSFVETTPTCCTGNHILNDYFSSDYPPLPVTPSSGNRNGSSTWQTPLPMGCRSRCHLRHPQLSPCPQRRDSFFL